MSATPLVSLTIDGMPVRAAPGTNLIEAARSVGVEIPHFCYHPHLSVAGNCRMCVVDIEGVRKPPIACATPVAEGMVVHTDTEPVRLMRRANMEYLLLNHPLDCPICDQSGECLLQDHYFDHAAHPSRLHDPKVTKSKRVDLGEYIVLDQDRCIACTRCVRFCNEITGTGELAIFNRSNKHRIGIFPGQPLSHRYQGCLADICPVGALTNKEFRFRKRVWWLKEAPSICSGCATGCNVTVYSQGADVVRLLARRNDAVNRSWMCDMGRMTYRDYEDPHRPLRARVAGQPVAPEEGLEAAAVLLRNAQRPGLVLGAQATLEANAALLLLARAHLPEARLFTCPGNDPQAEGYSDKILVHADKNPNTAGAAMLLAGAGVGAAAGGAAALRAALAAGDVDLLLVLEDDVLGRLDLAALPAGIPLICLAFRAHTTAAAAQVLLPVAGAAEQDGLYLNAAERVQRLFQAVAPPGDARAAYTWIDSLAGELGLGLGLGSFAQAWQTLPLVVDALVGLDPARIGTAGLPLAEELAP